MQLKKKNIALCIIFSIITCGIYGLYWLYTLAEDVKALSGRPDAAGGGKVLLLTIITCNIYGWYWFYKGGELLDGLRESNGRSTGYLAILYLVLCILGLGIVAYALMQSELNEYAQDA